MDVQIIEISCFKCNVSFWITKEHDDTLLKCHNSFYCPNGHRQAYIGQTDAEKATEERDRYKRWYKSEQEKSGRLTRRNSALRGVITRQKNRQ